MTTLFTIGYEGANLEDWLSTLKRNSINLVIDVREKPFSRKRGFSKNILASFLKSYNIDYVHIGCLGSPSNLRSDLHESQNYGEFFKEYLSYLIKQQDAIKELLGIVNKKSGACLMCFEKNPAFCHRSAITDYITARFPTKVKVEHIYEYVSPSDKSMEH